MRKKISQFDIATSVNKEDLLTIVQDSTNKNITRSTLETSLSETLATNEKVDAIEGWVINTDTKLTDTTADLTKKIIEGDATVTTNVSSKVSESHSVLDNKITELDKKHDRDVTEVNDTMHSWIENIDRRSTLEQLLELSNNLSNTENIVTALAELIANGGGSGVAPGFHTQGTNTIFPLTGYYRAGNAEPLATTDSLNQALSKLESQVEQIGESVGGDTKYVIKYNPFDNTQPTDGNLYSALRSKYEFLNKHIDDTTEGYVTFLKGLQAGPTFSGPHQFLGVGASLYPLDGKWNLDVDNLFVRGSATFNELIVNEIKAVGGSILVTVADMKCVSVTEYDEYYRCYLDEDVTNKFAVYDQAICQKFDGKNVKRYWRLVENVGTDSTGKFIDLSKFDCEAGSAIPEAEDSILQLGNRADVNRQSAIMISASGVDGPSISMYDNINAYTLENKDRTVIGKKSKFVGTLSQTTETGDVIPVAKDRGMWRLDTTYYYYDRVSYNGSLWLCMAISTTEAPNKEKPAVWQLQVEKGDAGAAGADKAKYVEIIGDRLFVYDNPDFTGVPQPTVITQECTTYNLENPSFEWVNRNTLAVVATTPHCEISPEMFGVDEDGKPNRNVMLRCTVRDGEDTFYDETQLAKLGTGATGESAYYIDLTNGNMSVPYDSSGNNPMIDLTGVYTDVAAYYGSTSIIIQSIVAEVEEGIATVVIKDNRVTLTQLGSTAARIKLIVTADNIILTKDLWVNKVNNGSDGFNGTDAASATIIGEQIFKYPKGASVPSPTSITLECVTKEIANPKYQWYWSVAGNNVYEVIQGATGNTYTVSPTGIGFNTGQEEITFKCDAVPEFGGSTYWDVLTIIKLKDGIDGTSPYRGTLSNEAQSIPATFDGSVSSTDINKTNTVYDLYQGTNRVPAYEVVVIQPDSSNSSTVSVNSLTKTIQLTRLDVNKDLTVFKIQFKVGSSIVDVVDFTISKSKGGVPGDFDVLTYAYASSQPPAPTFNSLPNITGSYSGGYYWYPHIPSGTPIWMSKATFDGRTGTAKYVNNSYWSTPTKVSGKDGNTGPQGPPGPQGNPGSNGSQGPEGPALVYRGVYDSGRSYYYTNNQRDVVKYGSTYYYRDEKSYPSISGGWNVYYWVAFGSSWTSVATGLLLAEQANIAGWNFHPNGYIVSPSNSGYLFGGGGYGSYSDTPLLGFGNSSGNAAIVNGVPNPNVALKIYAGGTLTVGDGVTSSNAGITGAGNSTSAIRFWAGNTFGSRNSAPFRVDQGGNINAVSARIQGYFSTGSSDTNRIVIDPGYLWSIVTFYDTLSRIQMQLSQGIAGGQLAIYEHEGGSSTVKNSVTLNSKGLTVKDSSGRSKTYGAV